MELKGITENGFERIAKVQKKSEEEEADTRQSYYASINSAAEEIKNEVQQYGGEVSDFIHQQADGSYWVIYYHANLSALQFSDNTDNYEDMGIELDTSKGWRNILTQVTYWAVVADIEEALRDKFGWDGEEGFDTDEDEDLGEV